jgi:hypothetical protein
MAFEFFPASSGLITAGIAIPINALAGFSANEFDTGTIAQKTSKAIYGILQGFYAALSPSNVNKLGISGVSKSSPSGVAVDTFAVTYSATFSLFADPADANPISAIPVLTGGTNQNWGRVPLSDVLPGVVYSDGSGQTLASRVVLIPDADIAPYLPSAAMPPSDLGTDNRRYLQALFEYLANAADIVRSATVASALTARSASAFSASTPSGALIAATNPTSGIDPAKANRTVLLSRTYSFTLQFLAVASSETFDVNVVTA